MIEVRSKSVHIGFKHETCNPQLATRNLSPSLLPLIRFSTVVCFFAAPFEFSSFVTLCHEILILSFL